MTISADPHDIEIQSRVLEAVLQERQRQDLKFGPNNNHSPERWIVILAEEFGETSNALLEQHMDDYFEEMIQVAAVAFAACECYLRNLPRESPLPPVLTKPPHQIPLPFRPPIPFIPRHEPPMKVDYGFCRKCGQPMEGESCPYCGWNCEGLPGNGDYTHFRKCCGQSQDSYTCPYKAKE